MSISITFLGYLGQPRNFFGKKAEKVNGLIKVTNNNIWQFTSHVAEDPRNASKYYIDPEDQEELNRRLDVLEIGYQLTPVILRQGHASASAVKDAVEDISKRIKGTNFLKGTIQSEFSPK